MPIEERVEMVSGVIKSGAIPLFTTVGGNALHLRGAPINEVVDCIMILLLTKEDSSILKWFDGLQYTHSRRLMVLELGARGWLETLSTI